MRAVWTIAKRELVAYFTSPVAYVFLVIFLLLTGFFTFTAGNFFERGEASLAAFFGWHPWLYLVLVPAVGMRAVGRGAPLGHARAAAHHAGRAVAGDRRQVPRARGSSSASRSLLTFPAVITVNVLGEPGQRHHRRRLPRQLPARRRLPRHHAA